MRHRCCKRRRRSVGPVERLHAWSAAVMVGGFALLCVAQFGLGWQGRSDVPDRLEAIWVAATVGAAVLFAANVATVAVALCRRAIGRTREDRRTNELAGLSGRCARCGYDLRAATAVRCPECGTYHGSWPARRFRGGQP